MTVSGSIFTPVRPGTLYKIIGKKDLQVNSIYNTLILKADFKCLLANYRMKSGTYGLRLRLVQKATNDNIYPVVQEIELDSGSMFGNPYSFLVYSTQEATFDISNIGTIDANGYIRIVGRKKEMIIRGGFNIYPREIEEVFYKHESVLEVAIIGLPDTVLGEISCAAIKLKHGFQEDQQSMKTYISEHVAKYKVPDQIVFLEEFPMTASGKIQKIRLQEMLNEQLQETLR